MRLYYVEASSDQFMVHRRGGPAVGSDHGVVERFDLLVVEEPQKQ
jgi:hypothetical protein